MVLFYLADWCCLLKSGCARSQPMCIIELALNQSFGTLVHFQLCTQRVISRWLRCFLISNNTNPPGRLDRLDSRTWYSREVQCIQKTHFNFNCSTTKILFTRDEPLVYYLFLLGDDCRRRWEEPAIYHKRFFGLQFLATYFIKDWDYLIFYIPNSLTRFFSCK